MPLHMQLTCFPTTIAMLRVSCSTRPPSPSLPRFVYLVQPYHHPYFVYHVYTTVSDGKVGIGTTSPAQMLHVKASDARIRTEESSGSTTFEMTNTSGGHFLDSSGTNDLTINKSGSANMAFKTANTERMRINGSGQLLVGTTSLYGSSNALLHINVDKVATSGGAAMSQCSGTGDVFHYHFRNGNGGVGGIKTTGSSSAFVTSSDYRLKENVTYTFDATSRLKQLKPARFNFKADADTTLDLSLIHI